MQDIVKFRENAPPSLLRRFAAISYDTLAVLALWFFATLIPVVAFLRGESIHSGNPFYTLYLLLIAFAYFGYCWTRSGQTLGMKCWKITLIDTRTQQTLSWHRAGLRFIAAMLSWAILGCGFLWALFDPHKRTLHDRFSHSDLRLVRAH